ncbi:ATP-binding protein [Alkalimonas collagenimarina]|uniref:ATP-binding protein n=1 Tax=Alkalimonas collagenimarina TaxID=400390 RepID=A0ABT9H3I6_9GAMM|nr:ATP-binding protein [Alkalimonas collagenimarina]MDP4537874.1 ATP-binding protein [Alkalimonas collagenimarina]
MKEYQLNVDPRILELLGPNLYTNIYYVLAELIANAYDADAKNVYIIANKDDIRVEDDGHGMSYDKGDISNYLNVAGVSRVKEVDSFSKSGARRKMGRKGVGKLAALSVSENVDILTVADSEKSGFILSRHPDEGSKLRAIPDSDVTFDYVEDHGSAIVMRNPQYRLDKTLSVVKRNILKLFPLINSEFRIHVIRGNEAETIDDFDRNVMTELGTLISLGDEYSSLVDLVPDVYPQRRKDLVTARDEKAIPLVMKDIDGVEHEYTLKVAGWIGTYKSTRGRKAVMSDFPDNFISLFANKKIGEFNILPVVGQNKLNEVYVVGQLHVDLFELTELPDMALSNRQGYKSDDPRYVAVLDYVRKELLAEILRKREVFTDIGKAKKKLQKQDEQKSNEDKLRRDVDAFRRKASGEAADNLMNLGSGLSREAIEGAITKSINDNSPDLGLKSLIDSQKKKILISQTYPDKPFADIIYQMLLHNNVPADDILYTNCDDEICRVPEGRGVYDYLREFFVESYSTQKIFVLFVTSENTKVSWGAITEVGASWITQVDHKIFNVHPFRPEHPLNDEVQWQSTNREEPTKGELWMIPLNADVFCQKIEAVCLTLGYEKKSRENNKAYLGTLIPIRSD